MNEPVPDDLIHSSRASTILQVSRSCVVRWGHEGKIRAWRIGGRMMFSECEVRAFRRPVVRRVRDRVRTRQEDEEAARRAVARMALNGR